MQSIDLQLKDVLDNWGAYVYEAEQWKYCTTAKTSWEEESNFEEEWYALPERQLLPFHYLNSASAAVSLFCYVLWLFASPHNKVRQRKGAMRLDLTCKSWF